MTGLDLGCNDSDMTDDEMTAEEFDRRLAAGQPTTVTAAFRRGSLYTAVVTTKVGLSAATPREVVVSNTGLGAIAVGA